MQTGTASIRFERPPRILQAASVVGPKEAEGPFGALFDEIDSDGKCGQDNWIYGCACQNRNRCVRQDGNLDAWRGACTG